LVFVSATCAAWAVLGALVSDPVRAAGTRVFRQATTKDFEDGEPRGSVLLPDGTLWPGRVASRVGLAASFVWCAARARDGRTAYLGSGDDGRVWALPWAQAEGPNKKDEAHLLAKLDGPWVTALAVAPDGTVLAGLTPKGRVASIDPKTGAARLFGRVDAEHVWSLAVDDATGETWVGAGMPGKIFLLDKQGRARQVWDTGDEHVVSMALEKSGVVLAGTSDDAILYRVEASGRAQALHDFEADEVRAILRVGDAVYVAVNDFEKTPVAVPGPPPAKGTPINLALGGPSPASAGGLPRPGAVKAKAAVYRLEADGRIEQIFALADGYLTALAAGPGGRVFASTGTRGRVYEIWPDRRYGLVVDLPERQALTLLASAATGDDQLVIGTGDVGGVYRTRPARLGAAAKGAADAAPHYLSKVLDGDAGARWGRLRWQGPSKLLFETRTGNTAKPDATWSAWQALASVNEEPGGAGGQAQSPAARYLQYRVTWQESGPLRSVFVASLPQNLRPRVSDLGLAEDATPATPPGRPTHSPVLKLRWKLENADNDEVVFRLSFHKLGEKPGEDVWRPLGGPEPLTKTETDWNTEGLADGLYEVRVVASDERSNPPERTLTSEVRSAPLLVDNRSPSFVGLTAAYPVIRGRARDEASPVQILEVAVDGGDWRPFAPTDGMADSADEPFQFALPGLGRGPHVIGLRVTDTAGNVGAAQVDLVVK
jgi:outer membrane protein assembly factor BamB